MYLTTTTITNALQCFATIINDKFFFLQNIHIYEICDNTPKTTYCHHHQHHNHHHRHIDIFIFTVAKRIYMCDCIILSSCHRTLTCDNMSSPPYLLGGGGKGARARMASIGICERLRSRSQRIVTISERVYAIVQHVSFVIKST